MRGTSWARIAAVSALLLGAVALPGVGPAAARTPWGADYFPNVRLTTQDGETVRFYDDLLKGKAVALNVFYTDCKDECPLETARLAQVQRLLGDRVGRDLFFYSISIDPERDTPEVMKAYAKRFGAGPGWLFLTGERGDVELIVRKLGLSRRGARLTRDGHSPILMIGHEPTGQWMRNSAVDNPRFLATTIRNFFRWREQRPQQSYAEARPIEIDEGGYLFLTRCSTCHTVGKGDKVGPDLAGVTARRDRRWLIRFLAQPDRLLDEGDPTATALFEKYNRIRMPNLNLTRSEIAALLAYLAAQDGTPTISRGGPGGHARQDRREPRGQGSAAAR